MFEFLQYFSTFDCSSSKKAKQKKLIVSASVASESVCRVVVCVELCDAVGGFCEETGTGRVTTMLLSNSGGSVTADALQALGLILLGTENTSRCDRLEDGCSSNH